MKKITIVLVALFFSMFAFGQEKGTHDLGSFVGFNSSNEYLNAAEVLDNGGTYENTQATLSFGLNYKIASANNWFFYADGAYQGITEDVLESGAEVGDVSHTYLTFGFGTEYHYIHSDWFQMYTGGSIAYTQHSAKYTTSSTTFKDVNKGFFNWQINALGFRFGKKIAATLELGAGYKGFANFGVSIQF